MGSDLKYDSPISSPDDDILGRKHFAETLAKSIIGLESSQGFVYGLYGPWGSGKSSIVNIVEHFIEQHNAQENAVSKVVIFKFNPWMFSGSENLTHTYLDQLRARLSMKDVSGDLQKVSKGLALIEQGLSFAEPVANSLLPGAGGFLGKVKETLSTIKGAADSATELLNEDLHHTRKKIAERLKSQKDKILVIIDDIDRLFDEEIKDFVKMIKAVCDFPRIIYLLACDSDKVAQALNQGENKTDGYDYLEKIVQCSFNVPRPSRQSLYNLFSRSIDPVLFPLKNEPLLFDKTEWGNIFHDGVAPRLETPRNIKTLVNSITACYPAVREEVNVSDFVGIQTIRVFYPKAYAVIDHNKDCFAGHTDYSSGDAQRKRCEALYKELHDSIPAEDLEDFQGLMSRLFPKYAQIVANGMGYGGDWGRRWKLHRKVCSPDCFDVYFLLSIPEDAFSLQEMLSITNWDQDLAALKDKLRSFINDNRPGMEGRYQAFLTELENFTEDSIRLDKIEPLLQAIYDLSDEVGPDDKYRSFLSFGINMSMLRVSYQLVMRFENELDRFQLLKKIFEKSQSLSLVVHEASLLDEKEEKEKNDTVTSEHAKTLISIALERIKLAAKEDKFRNSHQFAYIAYRWRDWAGEDDVKKYITHAIKTDEGMIDFLTGFLSVSMSHGMSDAVFRKNYRVSHKGLLNFITQETLDELVVRARKISSQHQLNERQKQALEAFISEKDDPKKYRD